jgi:hypothetical protein
MLSGCPPVIRVAAFADDVGAHYITATEGDAEMHLDLNPEQAAELRSVLDITLRDLSYEIASADLPSFRQNLRNNRELLRGILRTLDEAIQGVQPARH